MLKKLIPHFGFQFERKLYESKLRRGSTPASYENVHKINIMNPCTLDVGYGQENQKCLYDNENALLHNFYMTKGKYLELISQVFINSFTTNYDTLIKEVQSLGDMPLSELAIRTSPGQLFLIVMLHKSFTEDDRKWLLSVIKTRYNSFNSGDNSKGVSDSKSNNSNVINLTDELLCNKLFECLMDLGSDISYTLHYTNIGLFYFNL